MASDSVWTNCKGRVNVYPDASEIVSQDIGHPPGHHGGLSCTSLSLTRRRNWRQSADATGVARLEVFGSAARGTDFDPQTSDADFLVEFDPDSGLAPFDQFFDLAEALSMTLGRPVDLVEPGAINNPYLRAAINRSRELVYAP